MGGRLLKGRSAGVWLIVTEPLQVVPAAFAGGVGPRGAAGREAADDDDEADEAPRFGDQVDHFVFGLCDVMVVREERMKIRDTGGGRLREIHLGAIKLLKPTELGGRRVFKLVRRV